MFGKLKEQGFEVLTLHHAEAILSHDMSAAVSELEDVLTDISLPVQELVEGGGGEGKLTQRLRHALSDRHGWIKHNFEIKKTVDGVEKESISHEIDHVKRFDHGVFALEIEWNNKDPFYDRDLENFKRLHADGVISVGAIITRGASLHDRIPEFILNFARRNGIRSLADLAKFYTPTPRQKTLISKAAESKGSFAEGWAHTFAKDKFGEATTHWRKLTDRVHRGVGNPCPLLLIGLPASIVIED
ncbi:MAG: BglII/BstYI family type II restriction endonuclease [Planctomycetota bacterium]